MHPSAVSHRIRRCGEPLNEMVLATSQWTQFRACLAGWIGVIAPWLGFAFEGRDALPLGVSGDWRPVFPHPVAVRSTWGPRGRRGSLCILAFMGVDTLLSLFLLRGRFGTS